ncbi:hypothetical protein CC2G_012601 [Coprinopsis cinerea AmutBmut pab1-1]|nr:hypothetical protein CC2G_012601 [Coprinopsis cinerea AmutBmut pab1-1]
MKAPTTSTTPGTTLLLLTCLAFTTLTQVEAALNGPCDIPGLGPGTCLHTQVCAQGGGMSVPGYCKDDPIWASAASNSALTRQGVGLVALLLRASRPIGLLLIQVRALVLIRSGVVFHPRSWEHNRSEQGTFIKRSKVVTE